MELYTYTFQTSQFLRINPKFSNFKDSEFWHAIEISHGEVLMGKIGEAPQGCKAKLMCKCALRH